MKFTSAFFALAAALFVAAAPTPQPQRNGGGGGFGGDRPDRGSEPFSRHPHTRGAGERGAARSTGTFASETVTVSTAAAMTSDAPVSTQAPDAAATSTSGLGEPSSSVSGESGPSAVPVAASSGSDDDVVGAVYFTTNNPDGNNIVVSTIGSDGNVTYAGIVSTGGKGQHVNDGGAFAADATFSNNILVVHPDNQLLATTNTLSNTVALFKIDEQDPSQLTMMGAPVSSNGDYPASLVFNKAGDTLCVLNSGAAATVFCYDVTDQGLTPQASSLRELPGYNQTTPPTGPSNTASAIAFTENEEALVVAVKGTRQPLAPGFLVAWPLNGDRALADDPTVIASDAPASGLPFSLTPIPGRNAFLSADFTSAVDVFDFSGALSEVGTRPATTTAVIDGRLSLCWSTYSPSVDRYYLAATPSNLVVEVALGDDLRPSIIANHTVVAGANNIDLTVGTIDGQDYLYTILTNEVGLGVLRLDGPGQATTIGSAMLSDAVTADGAAIRSNYNAGIGVFVKPGRS